MWVHFIIPSLVAREVKIAGDALLTAVEQICSTEKPAIDYFLSAPSYFFVSHMIAEKFPDR